MKISMMLAACVLSATVFAGGCAAEQEDSEDDEDVGTDEAAAIHIGDLTRRIKAATGASPDSIMNDLAEHARLTCRSTRDANGQLSGPYGLVTMTVSVQGGNIASVSLQSPHANTAIGACIENDLRSLGRLGNGKATFTRTKRFTIKAPGKR